MNLVPQLGMAELILLGVLALVVVGPKDLPRLMHSVGKGMRQVRKLADEFRASFDDMAREAQIDEMRREIEALKSANPAHDVKAALDEIDRPQPVTPPSPVEPAAQTNEDDEAAASIQSVER